MTPGKRKLYGRVLEEGNSDQLILDLKQLLHHQQSRAYLNNSIKADTQEQTTYQVALHETYEH